MALDRWQITRGRFFSENYLILHNHFPKESVKWLPGSVGLIEGSSPFPLKQFQRSCFSMAPDGSIQGLAPRYDAVRGFLYLQDPP